MTPEEDAEVLRLLRENAVLVKENNVILKKLHKYSVYGLVFRIVWYAILIGLPFALYFVFEAYFEALGSNYDVFKAGIGELPGLKEIQGIIDSTN